MWKSIGGGIDRRDKKDLVARGDAARDAKKWRQAASLYHTYLSTHPADFGIWVQAGHAEKESGDLAAAMRCYEEAKRINPSDADLHLQVGHLFKLLHDMEKAAAAYRRSLELQPSLQDAETELAQLGAAFGVFAPGPDVPEFSGVR